MPAERIPDLATLSRVLHFSAGITKRKRYPGGDMYFRAAPNTGALYHIDLYLVCGDLPDLSAGVYHFGPQDFALRQLRAGDYRSVLVEASGEEPAVAQAPSLLVSASTYWRNAWKYQARAYRHCFWDAGTLHANLLAVAATERLIPSVVVGFADAPVERLLGLDPEKEGALTVVPLGRMGGRAPKTGALPELQPETTAVSKSEVDYPAIREIHAASSFASGTVAADRKSAADLVGNKTPAQGINPVFDLIDENKDQRIDSIEFRVWIVSAFDTLDANKDNGLGRAEIPSVIPSEFDQADHNNDDRLSPFEFIDSKFMKFARFDLNNDGFITHEEVVRRRNSGR